MKALIFTVTAGEGHNATAAAIRDALEARGHVCEIVNLYRAISPIIDKISDKGYLLVTRRLGHLYGKCYYSLEKRKSDANHRSLTRFAYGLAAKKTKSIIDKVAPDVIVSTHTYAAMIVDITKMRYGLAAKFITIETDFVMHPCTEETLHADRLVVACEGLTNAAIAKGFAPEQILPIGIPIRPKFAASLPKEEARRALGLSTDLPTLLIMSGSMGHGNMLETLKEIDGLSLPLQVVVICGNNQKQKEKIDNETWQKPVYCHGFVSNVDLFMDAADLILSKPGGLTTSEALAKRLPMLMRNPIDGQEKRNVEFLLGAGAALFVEETESVAKQVEAFFADPSLAEGMLAAVEQMRKPHSTAHLCDEMERLAAQ